MLHTIFKDNEGTRWERVDKRRAETLFNRGVELMVLPCKLRPFTGWGMEMFLYKPNTEGRSFSYMTDWMRYYNCDNERGNYLSFYVKSKDKEGKERKSICGIVDQESGGGAK